MNVVKHFSPSGLVNLLFVQTVVQMNTAKHSAREDAAGVEG
jgi:hypothetical protein